MRLLTDEQYTQIVEELETAKATYRALLMRDNSKTPSVEKALATLMTLQQVEPLKVTSKLGHFIGSKSTSVRKGDFVYAKKEQL